MNMIKVRTQKVGSKMSFTKKETEVYKYTNVSMQPDDGAVGMIDGDNVLNVYYQSVIPYSIEFYYDGVQATAETLTDTAGAGDKIDYLQDIHPGKPIRDGYKLDRTEPVNGILTASLNGNNVIRVYYIKDFFDYRVEYYLDGKLSEKDAVLGRELFGTTVTGEIKSFDNYVFDSMTPNDGKITLGEDSDVNVIKIYYQKIIPAPNSTIPQTGDTVHPIFVSLLLLLPAIFLTLLRKHKQKI